MWIWVCHACCCPPCKAGCKRRVWLLEVVLELAPGMVVIVFLLMFPPNPSSRNTIENMVDFWQLYLYWTSPPLSL